MEIHDSHHGGPAAIAHGDGGLLPYDCRPEVANRPCGDLGAFAGLTE